MRALGTRLGFVGAASAVLGAGLLFLTPFLPLVRDPVAIRFPRMGTVRPGPLENTLLWQTPITDWLPFVLAAVAAVIGLALSDRGSRRACLFVTAVGVTMFAWSISLLDGDLLAACNLPGLSGMYYCDPSLLPRNPPLEPGGAIAAAYAGAGCVSLAGVLLMLSRPLPPSAAEQRRRRLRSVLWI